MSRTLVSVLLLAALGSGLAMPALADDWVATKLRGVVLTLVDDQWVKLTRGEVVPDDRVIRTLKTGRVVFQRGQETVELGGDTQVQIFDRSGGKRFTTVKQYFGTVGVEAEVQNVKHFAVQTPYLAAVVKGTKFVVTSGENGARVDVERGHVAVEDRDTRETTTVAAGQSASSDAGAPLEVSGAGALPEVFGPNGRIVSAGTSTKVLDAKGAAALAYEQALSNGATRKEAKEAAKAVEKAIEQSGGTVAVTMDATGNTVAVTTGAANAVTGSVGNAVASVAGNGNGNNGNNGNGNNGNGNNGNGNSGNNGNGNVGNDGNGSNSGESDESGDDDEHDSDSGHGSGNGNGNGLLKKLQ